ncbi:Crp/Fnr family transcriptional regulator [Rhodovulum sp. ES.010]|uniref:Crp/Fnr family transcriptional regulator n=1 Tax=Rhodovulum sp. ES.010 TaxID=1882821 RepID=UPI000940814D|nr:Crp/Fnr family transcriptional regulator [Rhodovulum sp. ES.010]
MPDGFRQEFLQGARLRRFQSGEIVFHVADPATEFVGLADGLLEDHIDPGTGTPRLSFIGHPGWWIGGVGLADGSWRRATVVARTPAVVLGVPRGHVEAMARADGSVWKHLAGNISAHYDRLSMLLLASTHPDPVMRILLTLSRLHRFNDGAVHFPVTQSELAEMASLSRNTANRALRRLVSGGVVEAGYGWLRIADPGALDHALAGISGPHAQTVRRAVEVG